MVKELLKEDIFKNLKDAGCHPDEIDRIAQFFESKDYQKLMTSLKCQRCYLLEGLHKAQKKIDCLDYLIYTLKKDKGINQ